MCIPGIISIDIDKGHVTYMCVSECISYKAPPPEKKRKETLLSAELGKYLEKKIRVKFQGGREGRTPFIIFLIVCKKITFFL